MVANYKDYKLLCEYTYFTVYRIGIFILIIVYGVAHVRSVAQGVIDKKECRYIPENHLVLLSNHNIKRVMLSL